MVTMEFAKRHLLGKVKAVNLDRLLEGFNRVHDEPTRRTSMGRYGTEVLACNG